MQSVEQKLDVISFRFWTGVLLFVAVVANVFMSPQAWVVMMILSLPLVVLENVICIFA